MSIQRSAESASAIFVDPDTPTLYEPATPDEAKSAVDAFAAAYGQAAKTLRKAAERSRSGASSLSDDPLQGLSEVIQNADDQGASYVRIVYDGDAITFSHDGRAAHLKNIHAISLPWLTTNDDVAETTGRFGIGLSTLQALSDHFDFFSGPYRVRVGAPFLTWIDDDSSPARTDSGATVLRVPLSTADLDPDRLAKWVASWDHQGLMFLKTVRKVIFVIEGEEQSLSLHRSEPVEAGKRGTTRARVESPDGRAWALYSQTVDKPVDLSRKAKKTADTVTIDLAFPLGRLPESGLVFAGLPVEPFPYALLINAPLDPVTSRRGFVTNPWNRAVGDLIVESWTSAMRDLFVSDPANAWAHVATEGGDSAGLSEFTVSVADRILDAAGSLAGSVIFEIEAQQVRLAAVAAEEPTLEGIIDRAATWRLLDLDWLPLTHRDNGNVWRDVWEHWSAWGQGITDLITVEDAALLLDSPERDDAWIISLHAALIRDRAGNEAVGLPCIVTATDGRVAMPADDAVIAFALEDAEGLGLSLGISTILSEAYSDSGNGQEVLAYLSKVGRLLDEHSPERLLVHIARLGATDEVDPISVTDDQLREIHQAVEQLGRTFLNEFGPGLGRAILVDCRRGAGASASASRRRPGDAYLGRPFITDARTWSSASQNAVGWWVDGRYDALLQSTLPPDARIRARRFFAGLGASVYARVNRDSAQAKTYAGDPRRGTGQWGARPVDRRNAMAAIDATHTLDDYESPHLVDVAVSIADESDPVTRRRRAAALLESLRAGWRGTYLNVRRVTAASAYHQWNTKGDLRALWLWELGDIEWMDDSNGTPSAPSSLRLRSPSNLALYGDAPAVLVHPDLEAIDTLILREVGVAGEPNPMELLRTLEILRGQGGDPSDVYHRCLAIYAALGDWVISQESSHGDRRQIRQRFQAGSLINTSTQWVAAKDALRGTPVLYPYRAFTPLVDEQTDALWSAVGIGTPSGLDCANVLSDLAAKGPLSDDDVSTVVDILRFVEQPDVRSSMTDHAVKKWRTLPVWTGKAWTRKRPVYVTTNSLLESGLADSVPTWRPGVHAGQFAQVPELLGLSMLDEDRVSVEAQAEFDPDATHDFSQIVAALHDDLALNDEDLLNALPLGWDNLARVTVHACDVVRARVDLGTTVVSIELSEWLDRDNLRLLVRDSASVETSAEVASAVAGWFAADARHAEDAWFRAIRAVQAGKPRATPVRTAGEIAAEQRRENKEQSSSALEGLVVAIGNAVKPKRTRKAAAAQKAEDGTNSSGESGASEAVQTRVLIEPDLVVFTDGEGTILTGGTPRPPRGKPPSSVKPPQVGAPANQPRATHRSYTDEERERVGLEILRGIIESDDNRMHDLRAQHSVGADAIDDLQRFFELKVSGGAEPDSVTLEASQVERALTTDDFFLVVISGVERGTSGIKVRFIHDPVRTLTISKKTKLDFSGVRTADSRLFTGAEAIGDDHGRINDQD